MIPVELRVMPASGLEFRSRLSQWRLLPGLIRQKSLERAAEQVLHIALDFRAADLPAGLGQGRVFVDQGTWAMMRRECCHL